MDQDLSYSHLMELYKQWKDGKLKDSTWAYAFLLYGQVLKFPTKKNIHFFHQPIEFYSSLCEETQSQSLENIKFRRIKEKALVALKMWHTSQWPVKILEYIPTPEDLLKIQIHGIRPVSILMRHTPQRFLKPVLHRHDSFDFLAHDLEHVYMMMNDQAYFKMQVEVFNRLQEGFEQGIWRPYQDDPCFKVQFDYMLSDMNSHREHYQAHLRAILINYYVKKNQTEILEIKIKEKIESLVQLL